MHVSWIMVDVQGNQIDDQYRPEILDPVIVEHLDNHPLVDVDARLHLVPLADTQL